MSFQPVEGLVLLVDDNPINLKVLVDALLSDGLRVSVAKSGEQALEKAPKIAPDMILLDVRMPPGLDGFETCQRLKLDPVTQEIPVIFMTVLDDAENIVHAFEVGAVDYVIKPIRVADVLARVKTHLTLRRMQKELETQNAKLQEALANVKTLKGLVPICANCKKIRDDAGYWNELERYIEAHSDAFFSHGVCPECMELLYGKESWYKK